MNDFYVYALLDLRKLGSFQYRDSQVFTYEPIYIGKGKGNRCNEHFGHITNESSDLFVAKKIRKIFRETGEKPIVIKLYENLYEDQAFATEIFLIRQLGRFDQKRGPLCNLTNGGDGLGGENNPFYGKHHSEKTRKKLSKINIGKHHSEETKKKISISFSGEKHPLFGKQHSEETRKKMSEAQSGKHFSNEHKKKMSMLYTGENNPNYGKKHSLETIEKMRKTREEYWRRRRLQNVGLE